MSLNIVFFSKKVVSLGNLDKLPYALLTELLSLFDLSTLAQFRTTSKDARIFVDNQYPLRPIFQEIMSEPPYAYF